MIIEQLTLRELHMKLVAPFQTSMETTTVRRILLSEVVVDGVVGWGECVAGETPSYSPETTDTAWHILRAHLWPLMKGKQFRAAADVWGLIEPVRGHNMAKGALEAAIWDAEGKQKGVPLWKLLGGTREEIASGVSVGIKESLDELVGAVKKELSGKFATGDFPIDGAAYREKTFPLYADVLALRDAFFDTAAALVADASVDGLTCISLARRATTWS